MRPLISVEFPDPLPREAAAGNLARTTAPIAVWAELWNGVRFPLAEIPAGFVYDGLSRPGLLASWAKRWGRDEEEALLHDWLLALMAAGRVGKPKFLVDLVFLLVLVARGRSFFRACAYFLGVRTRPRRSPAV